MRQRWRRARLRALLVAACLIALLAFDATRPPASQWTARATVFAIHLYQRTLSPVLRMSGARCRFTPTCSRYAEESIRRHGFISGSWRAAKRIARCGPWTPMGTIDPAE